MSRNSLLSPLLRSKARRESVNAMNVNGKRCKQCGEIGHTKRFGCFEDKAKFKASFAEAETKKEACLSLRCGNVSSTGKQCNKVIFYSFVNKTQHIFRPNFTASASCEYAEDGNHVPAWMYMSTKAATNLAEAEKNTSAATLCRLPTNVALEAIDKVACHTLNQCLLYGL